MYAECKQKENGTELQLQGQKGWDGERRGMEKGGGGSLDRINQAHCLALQ